MLFREVDVRLRDLCGKHEPVMFAASGLSQLLEPFRSQHLAQSVGRIDGTVDHDVDDVNPLRRELRVEGLAEHSPSSHGGRVRMLSAVPAHRRR